MPTKTLLTRLATFGVVAVLSALLLILFPFYPFYIAIVLAIVLGAVSLQLPYIALVLAIVLSTLASMYQNALAGLIFLVVIMITIAVTTNWLDVALIAASWVLAFFTMPSLAIAPTVLAGLHRGREDALKIGLLSALSIFLLSWIRGIVQAGLLLVPSPATYAAKAIPDPWQFSAFIPNADVFSTARTSDFYAPLGQAIGDFRIYVLIAAWAVAGYLIAFLVTKWRQGPLYVGAAVAGILPPVILAIVFAQTPLLQIGVALVSGAIVAAAYTYLQPVVTGPSLNVFSGLDEIIRTGMPQKYSILLGSPACDERNLVVEDFVQSGLKKKAPCFLLTSDTGFASGLKEHFGDKITVLVANPRAPASQDKTLIPVQTGVQNLTSLNIELVRVIKDHAGSGARVILDVMSEMLLSHKLLTTRKWASDILPRLEGWSFTTIGVFNPSLHTPEDVQGLIELFNGYVEIFEKDYAGKARKLIAVRKMANLQYNENELLIDKQQLARKDRRGRLS
jgi:KaiC/GvpD/RAD55 family RecA-like ATPase